MSAYLSLTGRRRGGCLFEVGRLLTFSAFRMGAYSRWALIRGWALIRINTVVNNLFYFEMSGMTKSRKPCLIKDFYVLTLRNVKDTPGT